MNVTSVAGSTSGTTRITVVPTLTSGNSYKYKTAANPTIPKTGALCNSGYTAWDGEADITATVGHKVVIVEVDSSGRCVHAGIVAASVAE